MSLPRLDFRSVDVTLPANNPGDIAAAIESVSTMSEPVFITLRARDVKPYHYGLWSSVGGDPFANCICSVKWSDDGAHLWFMLESHNFYKVEPDEEIEVVELTTNRAWATTRAKYADWTLPPAPRRVMRYGHAYRWSPDGPECDICGSVHQPNLEPLEEP